MDKAVVKPTSQLGRLGGQSSRCQVANVSRTSRSIDSINAKRKMTLKRLSDTGIAMVMAQVEAGSTTGDRTTHRTKAAVQQGEEDEGNLQVIN